jgi:hypothetical protein
MSDTAAGPESEKWMRPFFASILLLVIGVGPVWAWGKEGHAIVAQVAMRGLGPNAKRHVAELVPNGDLATVASWADDLRLLQRNDPNAPDTIRHDPDALAFLPHDPDDPAHHRPAKQPSWHFTETVIGAAEWQKGDADDAVTLIQRCIRVLAGHPDSGHRGESEFITKTQAIRFLVHFVGDLHQPLHAADGFWSVDASGKATLLGPDHPANALNDRGANEIFADKTHNLHAFWDIDLVLHAEQKFGDEASYVAHLVQMTGQPPAGGWTLPGDPLKWPESWANDSLEVATVLYGALQDAGLHTVDVLDARGQPKKALGFVTLDEAYKKGHDATVDQQLAAAGKRLAATLNALWKSE